MASPSSQPTQGIGIVKDCRNNVFITLNGKTVYSRNDVATSDVGHNAPLLLYSPLGITIIDCLPY